MEVPSADLSIINEHIVGSVNRVLQSGRFINGQHSNIFATRWAKLCGAKFCVPVASGSAALIALIRAAKTAASKYAIVPNLSFAATSFAVVDAGLIPVFCRTLPNGLMDQDHCLELLEVYGQDVTAVIPVHLYGQVMRIKQEILESDVFVIEDACQAHGVFELQGTAAAFSFYPSKNLGAAGDAGAVVTQSQGLASIVRAYVNYGDYPGEKYTHSCIGNNLRMDEIQAAVLNAKLDQNYLEISNRCRGQQAVYYQYGGIDSIATTEPNSWHLYPVLVDNPKFIQKKFAEFGIEVGIHYPYTLAQIHQQYNADDTNSLFISKHVLTLPIGPHLCETEINYVIDEFHKLLIFDTVRNYWRSDHAN